MSTAPAPRSVSFLLTRLGFASAKALHATLAPLGLEPRQFAVLRHVGANEGGSQQALGEALAIPKSRMVAIIDDLEARGLVERRANPTDRRARALYLTRAGREALAEALDRARVHEEGFTEGLTDAEREQLLGLLEKLVAGHAGSPPCLPGPPSPPVVEP